MLHPAFAGEHAAPAVDEFAAQGALIQPAGHAVAEPDKNALLHDLVLHVIRTGIETLILGDAQELLE